MDQLPRHRGLLRDHLQHGRRLLLLPRRPPAAPDPLPLQQRAARPRRPLPVPAGRRDRRRLEPHLAAHAARPRGLHLPARPGLHGDRVARTTGSAPRRLLSCRSARRSRSGASGSPTSGREPARLSLFSAVEFCLWDAQDDATNFQRNYSVGEVEVERRRDLPQDRVPRAARPLRLLRLLRTPGRLRHAARRVPRAVPRLGPPDRGRARRTAGTRSPTAGSRSARTTSRSTLRRARRAKSSSCSATPRTRPTRSSTAGPRSTSARRAGDRALPAPGAWSAPSMPCATTGTTCSPAPGRDRQRARRPDGQHLERLPVHGHVQPVALGVAVRVGHRPGDGLPRLEPGPAGFRAHESPRAPASGSSTSRRPSCPTAARTTSTSR